MPVGSKHRTYSNFTMNAVDGFQNGRVMKTRTIRVDATPEDVKNKQERRTVLDISILLPRRPQTAPVIVRFLRGLSTKRRAVDRFLLLSPVKAP